MMTRLFLYVIDALALVVLFAFFYALWLVMP